MRQLRKGKTATLPVAVALSWAWAAGAGAGAAGRHDLITGTARTECGHAISRFTVSAYGFDGNVNVNQGGLPFLGQTTGHNGSYALVTRDSIRQRKPVDALVRSVESSARVSAAGQHYVFGLDPTDGKPNGTGSGDFKARSGNGIVRNFVLRTSGLRPGERAYRGQEIEGDGNATGAFYGGNLILNLGFYSHPGQILTVTLVPSGRVVDGCPARTIVRTADLGKLGSPSDVYVHSIPNTGYTLSVKLNGVPLPLHHLGRSDISTALPISFPPTPQLPDGGSPVSIDAG